MRSSYAKFDGLIWVRGMFSRGSEVAVMTHHRVRHMSVLQARRYHQPRSVRLDDLELEINVLRDAYIAAR
jgi:hypothetical protein